MEGNLVFCAECRNNTTYNIKKKNINGKLKGEVYSYFGEIAQCDECGKEIYIADINDNNLNALYEVYRKENNIIDLENILTIPGKYAIGKRPLSLLLGWGEQTFSRYSEGDMPTKQYSDILQQIYDDPNYYNNILEKNKNNLKTEATYKKSKKEVNRILGINDSRNPKIELVINYLINQCEDITPLALQKALYYSQGFFYAFNKEFLFLDDCEAWIHGPVFKSIYKKYSNYRFDSIKKVDSVDSSVFSSTEKAVLDSVVKNVCCYSGKVLENFTHTEKPWLETRGNLSSAVNSNRIIKKDLIGSYFSAIKNKFNMSSYADIKEYTQKRFMQI